MLAVLNGHLDVTKMLLKAGADVNATRNVGSGRSSAEGIQ
jgi:ankyrin repeat protein